MERGQSSHLASTVATALQYLADVREVALTGRAADGTLYTPLPAPEREELARLVEQICEVLTRTVTRAVPDQLDELQRRKPLTATRMWLSTLLYMVQEQIEDLEPGRMSRRYGPLPDDEAADLSRGVGVAVTLVRQALGRL